MRSDFYKEDEKRDDELIGLLEKPFKEAINNLKLSREEEGAKLAQALLEHKSLYANSFEHVVALKGSYQDKVKDRLLKKFEKEGSDFKIDEPRFLQEVIYYLEKLDIDEEVNRIHIHLEKLESILTEGGQIGRQIDFLIQELNRETNTIGSKSGSDDISGHVVEMKVQLEKIREQALNLQ